MKSEKSRKIVMFGAAFLILSLVFPIVSGGGPPSFPHTIKGENYYSDDTPVVNASVTLNSTRTSKEVERKTDENGEWEVEVTTTIDAKNGDEILVTAFAPNSVEKRKSAMLVINKSEFVQEVNFVFEKKTKSSGSLSDGNGGSGSGSSSGDGSSPSDELPEEKVNVTEEEKGAENMSEQQPSPSLSPSEIEENGNESVAGEMPSPTKEGESEGKDKSIPGFQLVYAGIAGLIAIML